MRCHVQGLTRTPTRPWAACLGLAAALLGSAAGCGSDAGPSILLNVLAQWKDDPGTTSDVGYELWVDFGWPSRSQSCFPAPPDLTVTVDGRSVAPDHRGDCEWDIFIVVPNVAPDMPVDVRVSAGSHVYGEAIYDDLFPGFGAQLIGAGDDGTMPAGSPVTVQFPGMDAAVDVGLAAGHFHWLDLQPGTVPFYTYAPGTSAPDGRSVQLTAPSITGRASLVIKGIFADPTRKPSPIATTCTGFTNCLGTPSSDAIGPLSVTVVP
jgi:hypothetical protein